MMFGSRAVIFTSLASALLLVGCGQRQVSFRKDVEPILQRNCAACHSPNGIGYESSGFSVESYASLMKGTKYGPMIDPGASNQSNLVWLLEHRAHPKIDMPKICAQMGLVGGKCEQATPFARKISKRQIERIAKWIDQGAHDN